MARVTGPIKLQRCQTESSSSMRRWISIGPVSIRLSSKNLAPWGFPRLYIGGYSFWSWTSDGWFMPAAYHPKGSITWVWSATVMNLGGKIRRVSAMGGPKYSYHRLGFGWWLVIARQEPMRRRDRLKVVA